MTNKKIPCGFLDTTGEVGGRKRDRQPDCPAPVCQRELHEMLDVINHAEWRVPRGSDAILITSSTGRSRAELICATLLAGIRPLRSHPRTVVRATLRSARNCGLPPALEMSVGISMTAMSSFPTLLSSVIRCVRCV